MSSAEEILGRLEVFGVRLGLERTRNLLAALADPHKALRVVLVAGSNGKGSTSALLASILGASGYRVGLYTSPHLEVVEERIRISGHSIASAELASLLQRAVDVGRSQVGALPTYFEALTLAAFLHFQERAVDVAVLEVGLGGRLDATNVSEPILSLITSITLDHQHVLGERLSQIAREKAGVLRPAVPAACWVEAPEAIEALEERALELGCPLVDVRREVQWSDSADRGSPGSTRLRTARGTYTLDLSLLPGAHQRRNAALAVFGAEELRRLGWSRISTQTIERGIGACRWPGRLETVDLGDGRRVLLDAAHNVEAAKLLASHLASRRTEGPDRGFCLLFGALVDKAAESMLATLVEGADQVILTAPGSPRAFDPRQLEASLEDRDVVVDSNPASALSRALDSNRALTVVCGSIYLVGEVRRELRRRFGVPLPAAETPTGP
jgi:dihydrofolate synthase/folylpolyglutamate synthase